jgi:hypothetical protein
MENDMIKYRSKFNRVRRAIRFKIRSAFDTVVIKPIVQSATGMLMYEANQQVRMAIESKEVAEDITCLVDKATSEVDIDALVRNKIGDPDWLRDNVDIDRMVSNEIAHADIETKVRDEIDEVDIDYKVTSAIEDVNFDDLVRDSVDLDDLIINNVDLARLIAAEVKVGDLAEAIEHELYLTLPDDEGFLAKVAEVATKAISEELSSTLAHKGVVGLIKASILGCNFTLSGVEDVAEMVEGVDHAAA